MKTSSCKRFTLIELLVVIAIILILAGLVFPALGTVRNNAKKSRANTECQSLKTALIMYESEFSCWPATGSKDGYVTNYKEMCELLTGQNGKKMVFYEVGVGYDKSQGILDPWGKPYRVILDFDFNGKIDGVSDVGTINKAYGRNDSDIRSKVAVYSYGDKDKTNVSDLATSRKIVISW